MSILASKNSMSVRLYFFCTRQAFISMFSISNLLVGAYISDFPNCPKPTDECLYIHPEISTSEESKPTCRYWPNCTNPRCPFVHPLGTVGSAKRNQTPCRDGDSCTRPGCYFIHPRDSLNGNAELVS